MERKAQKRALRQLIRMRIQALSPFYCERADRGIREQIRALKEYQEAQTVFCFVGTAGEIQTREILQGALEDGKRVCVPRCLSKGLMEAFEIRSLGQLKPGSYGIPEPGEECPVVHIEEIDLALVPCLACTREGKRLGQGGGYYDRYFGGSERTFTGTAWLLCREAMILPEIPEEAHDWQGHGVISEAGVSCETSETGVSCETGAGRKQESGAESEEA